MLALLIPIVAICAVFGVGALKVWIQHREKLETLRADRAEREAERDRELLGLGSPLGNAHLEAVLARLTSLEERLAAMEQDGQGQALAPMAKADAERAVSSGDTERERARPSQADLT